MINGYKVSGHAGFAEEGMDIICSAVSALTQATLPVSYNHLRAHETGRKLVCRLLLEKKKNNTV